jgi:hypothetical protein
MAGLFTPAHYVKREYGIARRQSIAIGSAPSMRLLPFADLDLLPSCLSGAVHTGILHRSYQPDNFAVELLVDVGRVAVLIVDPQRRRWKARHK